MDENIDGTSYDPTADDSVKEPANDPRKKWIPLGIVGLVIVGSLVYTGTTSSTPPTDQPSASAPPTVLGTPSSEPTDDYLDPDEEHGDHDHNRQPVPVPDPDVTFASTEPPPVPVEDRKIPSGQNATQAPTTPDWEPTAEKFGNAWGNFDQSKEDWLKGLKPLVTDEAYEMLKYTEIAGLEKRTVADVTEIADDATGHSFEITFNENVKSLLGTTVLDRNDGWKWKVDTITEGER